MVFSSYIFIFYFLPFSLLLYYPLPWRPARHFSLTVTSFLFYGWGSPQFLFLMIGTTLLDYLLGRVQAHNGFRNWRHPIHALEPGGPRSHIQKAALLTALIVNIGLLGFFKYFNFSVDNYHALMGWMGLSQFQVENVMRVTLPIGISFYVFQEVSYAVDIYRGETKAMRSLNDYFCFVAQYQQMVAGPIVRYAELADQLEHRTHTLNKFARGVALFSLGLAMKVLLANPCGKVADTVFNAGTVGPLEAWYGLVAYAFQIYFDFAGYSEMAIGLGLLMGFVFAKNFETPYKSQSITEFWRRWHISLSSMLRDYLYIPLGGNRKGEARTYINLLLTMLIGGLWHGASWNFLIWGGIHGGVLAVERARGGENSYSRLPHVLRVGFTFAIILVSWVFFRSADLPSAANYLGSMFGLVPRQVGADLISGLLYQPFYIFNMMLAAIVVWACPSAWEWTQNMTWPKVAFCLMVLWLSISVLLTQSYNPFIYFIF
ncbi:MAG TPA: MBOAT family O-acyltransferase [Abditibacteriaceae bacterium]|jgi:alginate O-acetyltransferase complex protein AlgI